MSGTAQRPRFVIEERNWFNTPARCVQEGDAVRFYGIVTKIEPGAGKSVRITFDGSRLRPPLSLHMDDLVRGTTPLFKKFGPESGDTARTPANAAEIQPSEAVPEAVSTAAEGANSPGRSLAEIRATGAAWIAENEIARICDAINEAETLTSRAHDALYAEPFDRQAASDAIWKIHDVLRGLRDGR